MQRIIALVIAASACLSSCSPHGPAKEPQHGIPFAEGMRRLCAVDERAGLDPDDDPITIESARYDWALSNVEHPDVIELVTLMRTRSTGERVEMLRRSAKQAQLKQCALADSLESS